MTIEEKDFRLTQVSQSSPFWDLELLKTIKPKGGEPRQEFVNAGYGMTLSRGLKAIVSYRIACRHTEDVVSMKQYLKEYIAELKEVRSYIDGALGEEEVEERAE